MDLCEAREDIRQARIENRAGRLGKAQVYAQIALAQAAVTLVKLLAEIAGGKSQKHDTGE